MEVAEKASWGLATKRKTFGLENRKKSSQIVDDVNR
jgi:hypothetical protein